MSNTATTTQATDPLSRVSLPKVQPRPRKAITGRVTKFALSQRAAGDFDLIDIYFEPTRGSKKVFPSIMFRPEMVSFGLFDVDRDYKQNASNIAHLEEAKPKPRNPQNKVKDSYTAVYGMNIMPEVIRDGKTKQVKRINKATPLYAAVGGTIEAFQAFLGLAMERLEALPAEQKGVFGYVEFTTEQFVNLLNEFIAANPPGEQIAIIGQKTKESGDLDDNEEVKEWVGVLTEESHNKLQTRIDRSETADSVSKRIQRTYAV